MAKAKVSRDQVEQMTDGEMVRNLDRMGINPAGMTREQRVEALTQNLEPETPASSQS